MTRGKTSNASPEKLKAQLVNAEGHAKNLKKRLSVAHDNIDRLRAENKKLRERLRQTDAEIESLKCLVKELEGDGEGEDILSLRMTVNQLKRDLDYYQDMAVCERMAVLETENRMLRDTFRHIASISNDLLSAVDKTGALMSASTETCATDRKDRV